MYFKVAWKPVLHFHCCNLLEHKFCLFLFLVVSASVTVRLVYVQVFQEH